MRSISVFMRLGEGLIKKKYIVLLTDEERPIGDATIDTLKGSGQKAYRARILCSVAADGRTGSTSSR